MKQSMGKNILQRMLVSFASTVAVTELVVLINTVILIKVTGNPQAVPLVPSFAAHFSNNTIALITQTLLCGVIGASFGGCSVIFDLEKWSMVKQALLHFVLTAAVWIPVSMFCWGLGRYKGAFISITISICVTYSVTWLSRILYCRKETREINQRLLDLQKAQQEQGMNDSAADVK